MKWIEDLPDDFTHCFETPDLRALRNMQVHGLLPGDESLLLGDIFPVIGKSERRLSKQDILNSKFLRTCLMPGDFNSSVVRVKQDRQSGSTMGLINDEVRCIEANDHTDITVLCEHSNLRHLTLGRLKDTVDLEPLAQFNALVSLNLAGCEKQEGYEPISRILGLMGLDLTGAKINELEWDFLEGMESLTRLILNDTSFEAAGYLESCRNLRHVEICDAPLFMYTPGLGSLSVLQFLNVSGSSGLDPFDVFCELQNSESLLEVRGIPEIDRQLLLWGAATRREDVDMLESSLETMLELTSHPTRGEDIRIALVDALSRNLLGTSQAKEIVLRANLVLSDWRLVWPALGQFQEKFANILFQFLLERDVEATSSFEDRGRSLDRMTIDVGLQGWIHAVADEGNLLGNADQVLQLFGYLNERMIREHGLALALALRRFGLHDQEARVVGVCTHESAEFEESMHSALLGKWIKQGRLEEALGLLDSLSGSERVEEKEDHLDEFLIELSERMPSAVGDWLSQYHREESRKRASYELWNASSNAATWDDRYKILMDLVPRREACRAFVLAMAAANPEDPWVKALFPEVSQSVNSSSEWSREDLEVLGLHLLRQNADVRNSVGDMTLGKLIRDRGDSGHSLMEQARQAALDLLNREGYEEL